MKLIIMGIGGLIALLLIIGIIMYFMGVFDEPEPVVVKDVNVTKKLKKDQVKVITYTTLKKVNFKTSDINTKRLNGRLALLNKNSVLTPSQLSIEKIKEKKRLDALNIEKQYIEFAKHNKEEPLEEKPKIVKTEIKKVKQKEVITNNRTSQIVKQKVKTKTLKYIIVNSLQYKLFVNLLTQTNSDTAIASICSNDNGETVIFIGPFETDTSKNKMLDLIKQNDSNIDTKIENITKEQLNHYCNM
jgi:translation initiation factor 6 (eIF-6)